MNGSGVPLPVPDTDAALVEVLQEILDRRQSPQGVLSRLERRPYAYQTSFPLEELEVHRGDSTTLRLLFKDLSWQALPIQIRRAKPTFLHDPLREIVVYRDILDSGRLGTPVCYGTVTDAGTGRYWLFLEKVPGLELYQVGDLEIWQESARWLAGLHSCFGGRELQIELPARAHLLQHDGAYYRRWIRRAREFTRPGGKLSAGLERLAERYDRVIERLLALPRTFIHGEFYASNVLIRPNGGPGRVCPVDWEMAGFGPGLIDLAALVAGNWTEDRRAAIVQAYAAGLEAGRPPPGELVTSLDYCRLHLAIQWLGWSPDWVPPPEHCHDWLGEALHLAEKLERG